MTATWFHDSLWVESHWLQEFLWEGLWSIFRQCWCRNVHSATVKVVTELGSVIPKVSFWLCVTHIGFFRVVLFLYCLLMPPQRSCWPCNPTCNPSSLRQGFHPPVVLQGNWRRPQSMVSHPELWGEQRAEFLSSSTGDHFTSWSTRCDYPSLSMEMLVLAIKLFSPLVKK